MANWTPTSFIGGLFKTLGGYVPLPAGLSSPALWGTGDRLNQLFEGVADIARTERAYVFRYPSPEQ